VNSIVGAQLFYTVNNDIPGWAGIIIIAAGCGIITLFGYKIVHHYQKWSWIPSFIIFLVVLGEFAHSGHFRNLKMDTGSSKAGSVLSFAAAVFGNSTGWSTYAADYTVYMPSTTSRKRVFAWTFGGLCFPMLFLQMLGAAVGTAAIGNGAFATAYEHSGIGGLLGAVLFPRLARFGQFCIVVLALGVIANNCPNQYSISLNLQILSAKTQVVPRFLWSLLSVIVFAGLAIGGYGHFESFLQNFMLIMVSDRKMHDTIPESLPWN
jgi:purine-cytosine permease-like protein